MTVDGASSTLQAHNVNVGDGGQSAFFNVVNGGVATSAIGTIGINATSGTVIVSGAGSTWNLTSSGKALVIGGFGSGALTIANGGTVNAAGNIVIAEQTGSNGHLNIGAAQGSAAAAPGTVNAAGIQFGGGNGGITFNHNSSAYTFAVPLSGFGGIVNVAGHTILTGNSNGFTGFANTVGGLLSINGSLASGNVVVQNGGMVGGTGTIGTLDVWNGGVLAPGNSIGTLTVVQDALFKNGSIYQVQLDAKGNSDKLAVGTTTLIKGGTVQAQVQAGKYAPSTKYTILTSVGGVTGTFSGATTDAAFLTPTLIYDAHDVYLTMTRNFASFASVGTTRNQIATGAAVDSLGYGNALWNAVVTYNATQARSAFDQLSGDIHPSTTAALVEDSRFLRAAAIDRLREAFRSVGSGNPAMAYAAMGDTPATPDAPFAVWGRVIGSWGNAGSDGNAAGLTRKTGGFFSGFDARVADDWRVGVLSGYTHANLNSAGDASRAAVDSYHAGAYAGAQWGALALRTGAAYSWHHIDASRAVAIPGFTDRLASAYGADTAQVFGELGYNVALAQRAAIEPFAGLAYVDVHRKGFAETGGAAALTAGATNIGLGVSNLGLRGAVGFDLGGVDASWKGMLAWRHAYGNVTPVTTFAFAGSDPFSTAGLPIARDAAAIDAGFDLALARNVRFGIAYTGQVARRLEDHGVKANLDWKF